MRAFRFRAQPALDLRRREHDAAQRALARADAERHRVQSRCEAADRVRAQARHDADQAVRTAGHGPDREWYRFWIVRLDRERDVLQASLRACDAAVDAARAACLEARRRYEALERFREKAYEAYLADAAADERKRIDELATQRYALRPSRQQGA